ncbi:MAG: hypothetical protein HIU89_18340, partial [Proteobacteria bacterium]|nr:hypothetical protein [Pseudomonadota bacterium]
MVTDVPEATALAKAKRTLALLDKKATDLRQELLELRRKLSDAQHDLSQSRTVQLQEANQQL